LIGWAVDEVNLRQTELGRKPVTVSALEKALRDKQPGFGTVGSLSNHLKARRT